MKWLVGAAVVLGSTLGNAQNITITGNIATPGGKPFSGSLSYELGKRTVDSTCGTVGEVSGQTQTVPITEGTFSAQFQLTSTDCLQPRLPYYVQLFDQNNNLVATQNWYVPNSASGTANVGDFVAENFGGPVVVALPQGIIGNPAGSQTITQPAGTAFVINGNVTVTGTLSAGTLNQTTINTTTTQYQNSALINGTPAAMTNPWGYNTGTWTEGGQWVSVNDSVTTFPAQSAIQVQRNITATKNATPDYSGAPGASFPVVEIEGTCGGGYNLQCQAISGYMVNNGSQDAVGVTGRVDRLAGVLGSNGIADSAGGWFSAYDYGTQAGGVMGGEVHIYEQGGGITETDRLGSRWAVGLHDFASGTGGYATAGIGIDAGSNYGFYYGIVLDGNLFSGQNGAVTQGLAGTVGLNMGSWSQANGYGETAIKLGSDVNDLWQAASKPMDFTDSQGIYAFHGANVATPTTQVAVDLYAGSGFNSTLNFFNGTSEVGNIGYLTGTGYNYMVVNSIGTTDTHMNINGGEVYVPVPPAGDNSQIAATTGYVQSTAITLYNNGGTQFGKAHEVTGAVTLSGGTASVALSGKAAFTSSSTYFCFITGGHYAYASTTSGTAFTVTGTGSDVDAYDCKGT